MSEERFKLENKRLAQENIEYYSQICDLTSRLSLIRNYANKYDDKIKHDILNLIDNPIVDIIDENIDKKEDNILQISNTLENILYVLERIESKLYEK